MPKYRNFTLQENNFTGNNDNDCFKTKYTMFNNKNVLSSKNYLENKKTLVYLKDSLERSKTGKGLNNTSNYIIDVCGNKIKYYENYDIFLKFKTKNKVFDISNISCLCDIN